MPSCSKGWAVWLTGLPGSGKSVVAHLLWKNLFGKKVRSQIVSSDALRMVLTPNPSYSEDERELVYRAILFLSKMLTENGVNTIIDATGNKRKYRDACRNQIGQFLEVYLRCPLEVCIKREESRVETYHAPKEIYVKARAGKSQTVPGLGAPYEAPENPDLLIDTEKQTPDEIVQIIVTKLQRDNLID